MLLVDELKSNPDYIITDIYNDKIRHYQLKVVYKGNIILNESRLLGRCSGSSLVRIKHVLNCFLQGEMQQMGLL